LASLAALILVQAAAAAADNLASQASVIDGDTLEMHGTRIRLWGIDARKSSQLCPGEDSLRYRCGAKAANGLDTFIAGRPVSCIPISLEQYRRTVATCSVGGTDLAECLSARVSRWTGRSIRRASSIRSTVKPSTPGAACGQAATSSRGYRACIRARGTPTNCSDDANAHP